MAKKSLEKMAKEMAEMSTILWKATRDFDAGKIKAEKVDALTKLAAEQTRIFKTLSADRGFLPD